MFEGGGGPTLSPLGAGGRVGSQVRPSFITGLYQDEDRRLTEIARQGGLTFCHSAEGDVDIQERGSGSSIPQRHPPMNESTVDWSLLGKRHSTPEAKTGRGKGRKRPAAQKESDDQMLALEDGDDGAAVGDELGAIRSFMTLRCSQCEP